MKQFALMIRLADVARADVLLTPERVYYRFATEDTVEDGDLPGLAERFEEIGGALVEATRAADGAPLDYGSDFRIDVFVDNAKVDAAALTDAGLKRLVDVLTGVDDVFRFLHGFLK